MRRGACLLAMLVLGLPAAHAQTSASYKLKESTFNGGGRPANGTFAGSASYRIKLDAIGDSVLGTGLGSASYRADAGFVEGYVPPGEVTHVSFTDKQTIVWLPEKSIGSYDLYRDSLSLLGGGGTGSCLASGIANESAVDAANPAVGQGSFYLVTAKNRLGEEGTKGTRSTGAERPNSSPCP